MKTKEIPVVDTYTQSAFVTFCECPEKGRLSYIEGGHGIRPRVPDLRLITGKTIHKSLEHIYQGKSISKVSDFILEQYDDFRKSFTFGPSELQRIEMEANATLGGIRGYRAHYAAEIDATKMGAKGPINMIQFSLPLDWYMDIALGRFRLMGEIDGLGTQGKYDYIVETKTTSQISQTFTEDIELSPQTIFYLIGFYETYHRVRQRPVKTLFNYIRKPSIRQRKSETLQLYMRRVEKDYKQRPEFYFHRAIVERSPKDVLRLKEELIHFITINQIQKSRGLWYRNRRACNAKGRCNFFNICRVGQHPSVMSNFIKKLSPHDELAEHFKDQVKPNVTVTPDEEE